MKVLVSGASGNISQVFREHYRNYYSLKLIYHQGVIKASPNEKVVQADITNFDSVLKAMEGTEAVVHLAADARDDAPWDSILNLNLIGTYNVFEADSQMWHKEDRLCQLESCLRFRCKRI